MAYDQRRFPVIDVNKTHKKINQLFNEVLAARIDSSREVAALMLYERGRFEESLQMLESIDKDIPLANSAANELCYQMLLMAVAMKRISPLDETSTMH